MLVARTSALPGGTRTSPSTSATFTKFIEEYLEFINEIHCVPEGSSDVCVLFLYDSP